MHGCWISGHDAAVVGTPVHLAGDGPYEAHQFPGRGGGHLTVCLAGVREPALAGAQALTGCPTPFRRSDDGVNLQPFLLPVVKCVDIRRHAVTERGGETAGPGILDGKTRRTVQRVIRSISNG